MLPARAGVGKSTKNAMANRNIKKKKTSFGSIEILSDIPRIERMIFNKEGKSHKHDTYEYCYVLSGSGRVVGADKEEVTEGDFCKISPHTPHWMIPNKKPFSLIIFYGPEV